MDFLTAVKTGNIARVEELLPREELSSVDEDGDTPFMHAVAKGNLDIVKLFIKSLTTLEDRYAMLRHKNNDGMNAFTLASALGRVEILKELLPYKGFLSFEVNDQIFGKGQGQTALMLASKNIMGETNGVEVIRLLLDNGASINMRADNGFTALMYAVMSNQLDIVRILLERGAKVNLGANKPRNDSNSNSNSNNEPKPVSRVRALSLATTRAMRDLLLSYDARLSKSVVSRRRHSNRRSLRTRRAR
jgi:ankyrin repeat protein